MAFPYRAVTFDCFGTLIDWQLGQRTALSLLPALQPHLDQLHAIIKARGPFEIEWERGPWKPYDEILCLSLQQACLQVCGVELSQREGMQFAHSQASWTAFADTSTGLNKLAQFTAIGLLSNCDQETLERTAQIQLQAPIDLFVSSQQVQSYKPAPGHWRQALKDLQCQPNEVLHVSFTSHYDLNPAHELGFELGFLSRYDAPQPEGLPFSFVAPDLTVLVQELQKLV
ncbi:MAG: HAD hydrolase-like protein [Planctomycetes bacterium]|nr:HAD hydrolase-like protein [Planctomycetota bacterium]